MDNLTQSLIEKARILLNRADQGEWAEIQGGVWICSNETIILEIRKLDGDDDGFDFTTSPYWITTDCGSTPIAVSDFNDVDLLEIISRNLV